MARPRISEESLPKSAVHLAPAPWENAIGTTDDRALVDIERFAETNSRDGSAEATARNL